MLRRKDNLTDLTERLPESERWNDGDDGKNQEVFDVDGEIITLALKLAKKSGSRRKGKMLELSVEDLQRIISKTVEVTAKEISKRVRAKLGEVW